METKEKIYNCFSSVANSLGYSEVHGRIIAALLVENNDLSLQELSKATGYSASSISLSLDLLEIIGIVKKNKNRGDKKLYVKLDGDLIEGLRSAMLFKIQKEIANTLVEFEEFKGPEKNVIEKELLRLNAYIKKLSEVEIPDK